MPNSLKTKLSKLRYQGKITDEEYKELIDKLEGHDESLVEQIKWERDTAINQLEQLGYGLGEKVEPCEDCVSRDEALKAIATWDKFGFSTSGCFERKPKRIDYVPYVHYDDMVYCIKNLPSVQPQQRVYDCDFGQEQFEKRRFLNEYLRKWLSSFNTNSATVCFTEIQELKKRVEFNDNV